MGCLMDSLMDSSTSYLLPSSTCPPQNLPGQTPTMYPLHWAASVTLDIDHDPSGPSGYGPLSWESKMFLFTTVRFFFRSQRWVHRSITKVPSKLCIPTSIILKQKWLLDHVALNSNWPNHGYQASAARRNEHTAQWPSTAAATTLLLRRGNMRPSVSVRVPSPYSLYSLNLFEGQWTFTKWNTWHPFYTILEQKATW